MSRRLLENDRAPWSFFLPMLLAVACGVLIADGVRYAVVVVFADRMASEDSRAKANAISAAAIAGGTSAPAMSAPTPSMLPDQSTAGALSETRDRDAAPATVEETTPQAAAIAVPPRPAVASTPPATARRGAAAVNGPFATPAAPAPAVQSADQVERLPGSTSARRDKLPRACINGSVAARDSNGWQQELSSDRPVRCEQTSP